MGYGPGQTIPGTVYRVISRIGAGGMGTVYEVEDTTVGRRYVLKTLHPHLVKREDLVARLRDEARVQVRLRCRNIVDVITAGRTGEEDGVPYYVMEKLEGGTLRGLISRGGIRFQHVHQIATEILEGLYRAHHPVGDAPVVIHRDIKPENIFLALDLDGKTTVKLLDFGIMALLDDRDTGSFAGTPKYAAPEQFLGQRVTPQTDLYSAACVFYEMLAGTSPFGDQQSVGEWQTAHTRRAPTRLSEHVVVPQSLDRALLAALSKNPEKRPRDAYAFMVELDGLKWIDAERGPAEANKTDEMLETAVNALGLDQADAGASSIKTAPGRPPRAGAANATLQDAYPAFVFDDTELARAQERAHSSISGAPQSVDRSASTPAPVRGRTLPPMNGTAPGSVEYVEAGSGGLGDAKTDVDAKPFFLDDPPSSSKSAAAAPAKAVAKKATTNGREEDTVWAPGLTEENENAHSPRPSAFAPLTPEARRAAAAANSTPTPARPSAQVAPRRGRRRGRGASTATRLSIAVILVLIAGAAVFAGRSYSASRRAADAPSRGAP